MKARIDYTTVPEALRGMYQLEHYIHNSGLEESLVHLVKMRASQINGCAYCLDVHSKDARALGETEQRLFVLDAWEEAAFYSERERAALALTEAVTRITEGHVPDAVFERAQAHFNEQEMIALVLTLAALDQALAVRKVKGELRLVREADNERMGTISIGKGRISLRKFTLPEIENIYVKPADQPADDEDNGVALKRYIDRNDFFTVLFSDPTIVYLDGELYKDDSLTDGAQFLSYIRPEPALAATTSEKGNFAPAQVSFEGDSVFRVLVDRIAAHDEVLVCDDLGDEWADFIGIDTGRQPKTISFYHAKFDDLSLGASPLQILVSQAIKNLGRLNLSQDDLAPKFGKWANTYEADNVTTAIPRIIRGDMASLQNKITDALSSPDTIRRVFIVTSSLSRAQLEGRFVAFRGGEAPRPHFVQLYQLLRSYFSACIEVGAYAYVVCRE